MPIHRRQTRVILLPKSYPITGRAFSMRIRALAVWPLILLTGLGPKPLPAAPDPDGWGGFYAGAQAGGGNIGGPGAEGGFLSYGIHLGYLHDFGRLVAGAELGYDNLVFDLPDLDSHLSRFKLVAGYDAGRWLPYATVGTASLTFMGDRPRQSDAGVLAGLGVSTRLGDRGFVSAEILHHAYPDFDNRGADRTADTLSMRYSMRF
jgi:hypothetical protein